MSGAIVERAVSPFRFRTRWQRILPVAAIVSCVATTLMAVTYDAANPPSASLSDANGSVEFEFDGGGAMTKLLLTPNNGATLTLDGDTLNFAAGAKIILGQGAAAGGGSVVSNRFIASGALEFVGATHTNMMWSGGSTYLPNNLEKVVLNDVYVGLENIVPLTGGGKAGTADVTNYKAYFPTYLEDGTLLFELQRYNNNATSPNTRGMLIALKQFGNVIKAKWLTGGIKNNLTVEGQERLFTYAAEVGAPSWDNGTASVNSDVTYNYGNSKANLLVFKLRNARQALTFAVSGTIDLPSVSGGGVAVSFDATLGNATATTTINANGANTMTNSAYVIKGDVSHPIVFNCVDRTALPGGTTDCYGNVDLYTHRLQTGLTCDGKSAITMHQGSRLYQAGYAALGSTTEGPNVALDAATLYALWNDSKWSYCNFLTLSNGSSVVGGLFRVGYSSGAYWRVKGSGASVSDVGLYLVGHEYALRETTIEVDDTVGGDAADFIFNGDIEKLEGAKNDKAAFVKTGVGTMLMNGTLMYTNYPTRIVEGTLTLGRSGVTVMEHKFSLDGGTLALASGTTNMAAEVTVTANSTLAFGSGAALILSNLAIADGTLLALSGDVPRKGLKVETALDAATLGRIRFADGRKGAVRQTSDGYVVSVPKGLAIVIF